jgi:transglutaminase-like putative cysteine protease
MRHVARTEELSDPITLRVGCRLDHIVEDEVHAIALVEPHSSVQSHVVAERWEPESPGVRFEDLYGNVCRRFELSPGSASFAYDATIGISREPDPVPGERDVQHRIEELPSALLHWLLPSRLCASDLLADRAWELFGDTPRGAERVQAVCDWIHGEVEYGVPSIPATTAGEVLERMGGVCRDFAHLGVTFCRALGIPARYVSGYLPDIGIPGPYPTMDFHAWFEVFLGEGWWTLDARFNTPRIGRVPIGRGRDAIDVAMVTTYGGATLETMSVWADVVSDLAVALAAGATDGR